MIIVPKKEIIVPIDIRVGMKGYFRLQTVNKFSGKVRLDTGWFPNLILTAGKNQMAKSSDWIDYCQVGTDNTAPNVADTSLLGHVAGTSTVQSTLNGQTATPPYYGWKRRVYRFAAGTVAANLNEVGVGWGTTGSTLISRALILDPTTQLPTTVTPLADELLDVTYELRYYPPTGDSTNSVTLQGVNYDTTTRAARVTDAEQSNSIGSLIGVEGADNKWVAYDGNIGATIVDGPTGTSANNAGSSYSNGTYSDGTFERTISCGVGGGGWNLGAGIRSVIICTTAGWFQTQFSSNPGGNTIPKDITYYMNMRWTIGWTEHV